MKEIPLTKGYIALVDDADYPELSAHKWYAKVERAGTVYAARFVKGRHFPMHRQITGLHAPDHIDGNGLNNQRHNLRPATASQNGANTKKPRIKSSSRFKGVHWMKPSRRWSQGRWRATIKVNDKITSLGYFKEEVDAAQVYNFWAEHHFGEFARLNTPDMENPNGTEA